MPYRLDRNRTGVCVVTNRKDSICSKILNKHGIPLIKGALFIELDFRKSKLLVVGTYHRPSQKNQYFFYCSDKALAHYSSYGKVVSCQGFQYRRI